MNDAKLAFKIEQTSIKNTSYYNFANILFQCYANVKLKSIEALIKIGLETEVFDAWYGGNKWFVGDIPLANTHTIENGTLHPVWKPEVVQLLDNMGTPFVIIVPDSIYNDSYIMGITEVVALHHTSNAKRSRYKFEGTYLVNEVELNPSNAIYFPSKEIGMVWWESVKNIIK